MQNETFDVATEAMVTDEVVSQVSEPSTLKTIGKIGVVGVIIGGAAIFIVRHIKKKKAAANATAVETQDDFREVDDPEDEN